MRKVYLLLGCLILNSSFFILNSSAQSPQAIPYQAVARDNSNNLITNQNVSLRFSIRDSIAAGTVVYEETQSATTNALGLFTVNIGQGTIVTGTFGGINWGANSKFLQTEIDPTGGNSYVNMGTNQMMSVPYALYASSGSQWTTSGSNIHNNNSGNVGISSLSVNSGSPDVGVFVVQSNGVNDLMQFRDNTATDRWHCNFRNGGDLNFAATAVADYRLYLKLNGNVGMGTSTPQSRLDVKGGLTIGSTYAGTNAAPTDGAIIQGNVGIGTILPNGQFELGLDQGRKPSTNTWTITSDERLKNIEGAYTKGLKEILQLQPIMYHYKNVGERKFEDEVLKTLNVGFSAQEVQKIFPEAVGTDADGYLNFNMHSILVAYVNAIKEQQKQIEELKAENASLKKNETVMKQDIENIKAQLGMDVKAEK